MYARDYVKYDALGLANLIQTRQVSAREVLDAAISQIDALNPKFNAVVEKTYDIARSQIAQLDVSAPFSGVPYFIKDLHTQVSGSRLTQGSRFLKSNVSRVDSHLVKKLKKAGFLILGRTNSPEFGLNTTTEPVLFGPTRNPWNTNLTTGGSSGGSAAAVSSGMVPASHATDSGGSIRIPASCCGLVGLKPSRGRILAGLDKGEGWHDMFTAHAVTRSLRDSAAILLATQNKDEPAPYRCPGSMPDTWKELLRPVSSLKIGVLSTPPSRVAVGSECLQALDYASQLCVDADHTIAPIEINFDIANYGQAFTLILAAKVAAAVDSHEVEFGVKATTDDFEDAVWHCIEMGRSASAAELNKATAHIHVVAQEITKQIARFDVVMSPTVASAPISLGKLTPEACDISAFLIKVFKFAPFTSIFNATGQPAISLPLYWSENDVPIGVQFASAYGREDIIFGLSAFLEETVQWKKKQMSLMQSLCL